MLKRILLCLFLLATTARAAEVIDYTDLYYNALESGYGYNVVQSGTDFNFMFVTFFIYGPDKQPTWYTAQLTLDQSGNYNGGLYATTGTFYGMPWDTKDKSLTQVGTASFQPTSPYTAKFIYTVTNPPALAATVTKALQRQTLTPITIDGAYLGGQSGAYSACSHGSNNGAYTDFYSLQVTQDTSGNVSMTFNYQNLTCTFAGTLTQFGQLYKIDSATYQCSDGLKTNASMAELRATSLGFEGKFSALSVGDGCREDATFGGPLN